ncbi:MAG: hypothetical protein IJ523_09300 [Succinivibrionaceae bacterium]|nr:hypothetical protein [Succinivibrionaceae bacterium]
MKKSLIFLALCICAASAQSETICVNGRCHNVIQSGNNVIIDGEIHSVNRFGNTTTFDDHVYQDFGGGSYSRDGEMHYRQNLGGGYYTDNGEMFRIDRY